MNAVSSVLFRRHRLLYRCLLIACLCIPGSVIAQWAISSEPDIPAANPSEIAYTTNQEGYRLEIYRDANSVIRSRFVLRDGMLRLYEKSCPTYQIDNGMANNNSIDGAPCLSNALWAEYIFGKIENGAVSSSIILALMDGINLSFRFRLENGDYRETRFSLAGSKRSLTGVIGEHVIVRSQ